MSYEVATQRLKRLGDLAKTDIDSLFDTPWIKIIPNVSDQLPNFIKMRNRMIGLYPFSIHLCWCSVSCVPVRCP